MSFRDLGSRRRSDYKQAAQKIKGRQEVNHYQQQQLAAQEAPKPLTLADKQRQARQDKNQQSADRATKIHDDDDDAPPPKSSGGSRGGSSPKSAFSQLSDQVKHFVKIVGELETLIKLDKNGLTPEDQWRTTTLLRSAEAADRDLEQQMQEPSLVSTDSVRRTAFAKLNRDYHRAHETLQVTSGHYQTKQRAEISLLSAKNPDNDNSILADDQEDFYERAMRQREQDIADVNTSMHKVNNIYKDLANIVVSQQDKVDAIEYHVRSSRAHTECGADELHKSNLGYMCGAMNVQDGAMLQGIGSTRKSAAPDPADEVTWSTPFETMADDLKDVHKDLVGLGKDVVQSSTQKLTASCNCASETDVLSEGDQEELKA